MELKVINGEIDKLIDLIIKKSPKKLKSKLTKDYIINDADIAILNGFINIECNIDDYIIYGTIGNSMDVEFVKCKPSIVKLSNSEIYEERAKCDNEMDVLELWNTIDGDITPSNSAQYNMFEAIGDYFSTIHYWANGRKRTLDLEIIKRRK